MLFGFDLPPHTVLASVRLLTLADDIVYANICDDLEALGWMLWLLMAVLYKLPAPGFCTVGGTDPGRSDCTAVTREKTALLQRRFPSGSWQHVLQQFILEVQRLQLVCKSMNFREQATQLRAARGEERLRALLDAPRFLYCAYG